MKLTSLSIKTQEFTKTMRGYDTAEVHTFLEKIAGDVQSLVNENKKLKEDIPVILCKLEMIFRPTFYDSIERLPVHSPLGI